MKKGLLTIGLMSCIALTACGVPLSKENFIESINNKINASANSGYTTVHLTGESINSETGEKKTFGYTNYLNLVNGNLTIGGIKEYDEDCDFTAALGAAIVYALAWQLDESLVNLLASEEATCTYELGLTYGMTVKKTTSSGATQKASYSWELDTLLLTSLSTGTYNITAKYSK